MLEFLPSLGSLLSYGSVSPSSKKAIGMIGRHKAIVYAYAALVILLLTGLAILDIRLVFPMELLPMYIIQVAAGALGAITAFKALNYTKASLMSPLGKAYVLLVLAMSIVFLGESLTIGQVSGSLLIIVSAFVLTLGEGWKVKFERWMIYLGISMLCRAYYYTFIKDFVTVLGAYQTTLVLEMGIVAFVVLFHALRGRDLSLPPISKLGFPALSGTFVFIGSLLYSVSVGTIGAALTAAISAGAPIVNAVVSYFLLGERLDNRKYAAILLLVMGLVLIFI